MPIHLDADDKSNTHAQRPWVWFMVDCFMLITTFFLLNFQFKTEDLILPQKLPPTGGSGPPSANEVLPPLCVHCRGGHASARYEVMTRECGAGELAETLAASAAGRHIQVRVSYDARVHWKDVMHVFNECARQRVDNVGLVPLRDSPP